MNEDAKKTSTRFTKLLLLAEPFGERTKPGAL